MRVFEGGAGQVMLDRHRERAVLGAVLDTVRAGGRAVLTVKGGIGVGKTRLLHHLEETASDFTVARASGSEPERELAYAGLQLMCAPMQSRMHQLPKPQREALNVAFGLSAATPGWEPTRSRRSPLGSSACGTRPETGSPRSS
jgi:hypothetical protein